MRIQSTASTKKSNGRVMLLISCVAALMAVQAVLAASPALAITERPGNTDMTNGEVYATALSKDGNTLYIGGKFSRVKDVRPDGVTVGRAVNNLAAIDVESGALIRSWRPRVTGTGAVVRSIAVKDGRVYVGGNFTTVEDRPRKNLAAFGSSTAQVNVSSFSPHVGGDTSYVYALASDDSRLYIGGGFSKINGQERRNLAAFQLSTGELDQDWKPSTGVSSSCTVDKCSSKVRSLAMGPERKTIFIGGPFSKITGSNGTSDDRQSIARIYADSGNPTRWKVPDGTIDSPQNAWDLTYSDGRLYAGFGSTGEASNFVAAFNTKPGTGGQVWRYNTRGNVQSVALARDGSRLFFGGHFGLNNLDQKVCHRSKYLRGLGSLDPRTGTLNCDFVPSLDQEKRPSYNGGWTLTTTRSYLWVGGGFVGISDSINQRSSPVTDNPEWKQTNLARFRL